jgi:pSer/pThr/pTyr-binding forkhead associated (FHA) protein
MNPQGYPGTAPPPPPNDYGAPRPQQPPMAPVAAPPSPRPAERQQASVDPERVDPNAPRVLAGFLVSYEGNDLGVSYPILQGQTLVGRKGAGAGAAIELEHGTASSRHAVLLAAARPGRIKVEDIGSTNGTFVGDLMLERGKKHELKDGDVVRFGGYVTIVKIV